MSVRRRFLLATVLALLVSAVAGQPLEQDVSSGRHARSESGGLGLFRARRSNPQTDRAPETTMLGAVPGHEPTFVPHAGSGGDGPSADPQFSRAPRHRSYPAGPTDSVSAQNDGRHSTELQNSRDGSARSDSKANRLAKPDSASAKPNVSKMNRETETQPIQSAQRKIRQSETDAGRAESVFGQPIRMTGPDASAPRGFQPSRSAPASMYAPAVQEPLRAKVARSSAHESPSQVSSEFKSSRLRIENALVRNDSGAVDAEIGSVRERASGLREHLNGMPLDQKMKLLPITRMYEEGATLLEEGRQNSDESKVRLGLEKIDKASSQIDRFESR